MKNNPSSPYRTMGLKKITAPRPSNDEPKSKKIKESQDLRVGGGK